MNEHITKNGIIFRTGDHINRTSGVCGYKSFYIGEFFLDSTNTGICCTMVTEKNNYLGNSDFLENYMFVKNHNEIVKRRMREKKLNNILK